MVLKIRPLDVERLYTNEEFEALPAEFENYELIKGRLVEKMPSGDRHGRIAERLHTQLILLDPKGVNGWRWRDTTFRVGPGFEPKPDLAYIVAARVPPETDAIIPVCPDLVVEVHSPSDMNSKGVVNNAAQSKIADYLKFGVRIVWAVNPKKREVEVYHSDLNLPVMTLTNNDELDGEDVIPGFKMTVSDLFE